MRAFKATGLLPRVLVDGMPNIAGFWFVLGSGFDVIDVDVELDIAAGIDKPGNFGRFEGELALFEEISGINMGLLLFGDPIITSGGLASLDLDIL